MTSRRQFFRTLALSVATISSAQVLIPVARDAYKLNGIGHCGHVDYYDEFILVSRRKSIINGEVWYSDIVKNFKTGIYGGALHQNPNDDLAIVSAPYSWWTSPDEQTIPKHENQIQPNPIPSRKTIQRRAAAQTPARPTYGRPLPYLARPKEDRG